MNTITKTKLIFEDFVNPDFSDVPETVKVAGVTIGNKQDIIAEIFATEPINLVRDYKNEYDCNAIAVIRAETGQQLGWIPRDIAEILAPYYDMGFRWDAYVADKLGGGDVNYGLRINLVPLF